MKAIKSYIIGGFTLVETAENIVSQWAETTKIAFGFLITLDNFSHSFVNSFEVNAFIGVPYPM